MANSHMSQMPADEEEKHGHEPLTKVKIGDVKLPYLKGIQSIIIPEPKLPH